MARSPLSGDLTGVVFGRLTVLSRAGSSADRKTSTWTCKCDCGRELVFRRSNLISGHTNSCGCLARELTSARQRATRRPLKICKFEGCDSTVEKGSQGFCGRHAQRKRRYGDPGYTQPEAFRRTNNRHAQPRLGEGKPTTYKKLHGRHEHRAVMEAHIGRPLRTDEIIHHIDGNARNNAIENLQIVTAEEHARIHAERGDLRRKG